MAIERILQLKDLDWMRGISLQASSPLGGIFSQASNFDPFEVLGIAQPSLAGLAATGDVLNPISFLTPISTGGTSYLYGHATSKLFQITSGNVVTDITTASGVITTSAPKGAIFWRGKYIYAITDKIYANTIGTTTNTLLLSGLTTTVPHIFTTGPNGNLYFTNGASIGKITSDTGTSGNSATAFTDLDSGTIYKDILNDGRYICVVGDTNTGTGPGKFRCIVGFWDTIKGNYEQLYDQNYIDDSYLIACEIINGAIYVIGKEGLYVCSVATAPQLVADFTGNSNIGPATLPNAPAMVTKRKGTLLWGYSGSGSVYGYGTSISGGTKIFFQPYTAALGNITALAYIGSVLFIATDNPSVYRMSGTTRNNSTIKISNLTFETPYKFEYAKAVLRDEIASGQSIALQIHSKNGSKVVSDLDTFNFTTSPGKQTIIFPRKPTGTSDVDSFEELSSITLTLGAIPLERFEIWATPQDPQSNQL